MLACFFLRTPAAGWMAALLAVVQPIALMTLGAARHGSLGPLRTFIPLTAGWYGAVMAALLWLRGSSVAVFGVPLTAVLMLGGLWLTPMVFVTAAYLKSFSRFTLTDDDLDRIRHHGQQNGRHRPPR